MDSDTQLVVIGGFPGTGKSTVAGLLADELRAPVLASDLMGNTIKAVLADHAPARVPSSVAFRAGYATLFALAEEFASHGSSAIIDITLGWRFQWDALDAIQARHRDVGVLAFILECSRDTSLSRLQQRHLHDPERYPPASGFIRQPQLAGVEQLLGDVYRPNVYRVDAERPVAAVLQDIRGTVESSTKGAR